MAASGDSNQRPAPVAGLPQPSFNTLQFGTMSDSQLRQTITQLSHAASGAHYQAYAAPTPQRTAGKRPYPSLPVNFRIVSFITASQTAYQKNIANWSTSSTPPPRTGSRRSRPAKSSNLAPAPPTPARATTSPMRAKSTRTDLTLSQAAGRGRRYAPRAAQFVPLMGPACMLWARLLLPRRPRRLAQI